MFRKASDLMNSKSLATTVGAEPSNKTKSDDLGQLLFPSTSGLSTNLHSDCTDKSDTSVVLIKKKVPVIKYFFEETAKDESEVCPSDIPSSSNMLPDVNSEHSASKYASTQYQGNQQKSFTGMKRQLNEVVIYLYYYGPPIKKDQDFWDTFKFWTKWQYDCGIDCVVMFEPR